MKFSWFWPAILLLSVIAVISLVIVGPGTPLQPYVVMEFLFLCPGMAYVPLLKLNNSIIELTLGVALSLSIDAIVAGCFLYAHAWSPSGILWVLDLVTLLGASIQILLPLRGMKEMA